MTISQRALIFDMDGTIVDNMAFHTKSWLAFFERRGQVIDPTVSAEVLGWLSLDTDLSLAAGAFGLDPLAHTTPDRGRWLAHKTGTDVGLRADVGVLRGPLRNVAYAVLTQFDDTDRDDALAAMRDWGTRIAEFTG